MNALDIIPTIDNVFNISSEALDRFIQDGFAYVKIPNQSLDDKLNKLAKEANAFFKLPKETKEDKKLDPITLRGYVDRRKEKNKGAHMEQVTFPTSNPVDSFKKFKEDIDVVSDIYRNEIVIPLLKAIFHRILHPVGFESEKIDRLLREATDEIFSPMSLLSYPHNKNPETDYALPEHVDEDMLTVLWVIQDGLQVWLDRNEKDSTNSWYNINSKNGYVIVNTGKALTLMLGKRCNAIKHRVQTPKQDRLSIGVFYNPPITYKIRDLISDELLFNGSYAEYLKDHFSQTNNDTFYNIIEQQEAARI
jgi:isopenicillin N synthase-like dioxygenase